MLVLLHRGRVLLEKRPPTGVWGALWSFPEIGSARAAKSVAGRRYGCEIESARTLAPIAHTFTHFALSIEPVIVKVARRNGVAAESNCRWLPIANASAAAVPAPVRRILQTLSAAGD